MKKKKLITGVLATLACAACFAGCDLLAPMDNPFKNNSSTQSASLEDAKDYLKALYKDMAKECATQYSVVSNVVINGVSHSVTWTVDDAAKEVVTVTAGETETVIKINQDKLTEDVTYTLTATITAPDGTTITLEFKDMKAIVAVLPEEGVAYKFYLAQLGEAKYAYLNGEESGKFLNYTEDASAAPDFYVEAVEGKDASFKFYYQDGETKKYITTYVTKNSNDKDTLYLKYDTATSAVFTYDGVYNYWTTTHESFPNDTYVIGTYGAYCTFSLSSTYFYSDESSSKNEQYPARLITMDDVAKLPVLEVPELDFEVPTPDSTLTIIEAAELGAKFDSNKYTDGKYYVTGVITNVYDSSYGNMYIQDENGNQLTIYGTYDSTGANRYDAMTDKPKAGDTVKLYGIIGQYNGTPQMKNAWIMEVTEGEAPQYATITLAEALEIAKGLSAGQTSADSYIITAEIKEVTNTKYGNTVLTDGKNTMTTYGLYNADGTVRYDAMETKPVAGDLITIVAPIKNNSGTYRFENPQMQTHYSPTPVATMAALTEDTTPSGTYCVRGEIASFYLDNGSVKGYVNIKDAASGDTTFLIYGLSNYDGSVAYGSLENKPVVGDTISVIGELSYYKGAPQLKNARLMAYTYTEADPFDINAPIGDDVQGNSATYNFATITSVVPETYRVQYEDSTYKLDNVVSLNIVEAHINTQLRLYSSSTHDGIAIFTSTRVISGITLNIGKNSDALNVYGSTDGINWTLIKEESVTSAFSDHTIAIDSTAGYKYLKLDVKGTNQLQIKTMTINFVA